jgi:uncharacterized protein YlxW (UPF0749 family)
VTSRHGGSTVRVVDASMTLLNEVYRRPLDPGYAEAAARRAAGGRSARRAPRAAVLLLLAAVLGLAIAAATLALRQPPTAALAARQVLEKQIEQRTDDASATQTRIASLSTEIQQLQRDALGSTATALARSVQAEAATAGTVAVTGPGLRVVLSDAPAPDPETEDPNGRVQDIDLQVLVNGLWAAGAEAVAVNGQRLTATSAVRSAGDAVLVDMVALSSPYTVEAIGNAGRLQANLARTAAGQHLATLRTTFGIGVDTSSERHLTLPGSGQVVLQPAQPLGAAATAATRGDGRAPGASDVASSAGHIGRDGT